MTEKHFIELLQMLDPFKKVVIAGYEGGFNEVTGVGQVKLKLNVNTEWYYGKHEQDDAGETALCILPHHLSIL